MSSPVFLFVVVRVFFVVFVCVVFVFFGSCVFVVFVVACGVLLVFLLRLRVRRMRVMFLRCVCLNRFLISISFRVIVRVRIMCVLFVF